jgi:hypothetical protein
VPPERLRRVREPFGQPAVGGQDHGRLELQARDRLVAAQPAANGKRAKRPAEPKEAVAIVQALKRPRERIRSRLLTDSRLLSAAAADASQLADIDLP